MPGSLWRASCPPPSGPLLRNVQIRSRRICPTQESVHRQTTDKTKGPVFRLSLSFYLMPGSSPTLAWGDPTLPSALRRFTSEFGMGSGGTTALLPPGKFCFIRPLLRSDLICIRLKIFSHPPKQPSLHACRSTLEDPLKIMTELALTVGCDNESCYMVFQLRK